jgi:PleD family two-component response regulator
MYFAIIDDSSVDGQSLNAFLQELGYQNNDVYERPETALSKIEEGTYSIVFVDIVMPDQDGYKFLRNLRINPKTAEQYIVLHSSKSTPLEMKYGIERAGANDYLAKPITKETLIAVIERYLAGKSD